MTKYKSCCEMRCCVGNCKIRANGGCYCACRMNDRINTVKSVIDGKSFDRGCIYVVDHESYWNKLSDESKKEELEFREKCKEFLPELEEEFRNRFISIKDLT